MAKIDLSKLTADEKALQDIVIGGISQCLRCREWFVDGTLKRVRVGTESKDICKGCIKKVYLNSKENGWNDKPVA